MSDTPRGPGWWLASDGKWYPPQPPQTPAAPQLPTSTPIPVPSSPIGSPTGLPPTPNYGAPASYSPYGATPPTSQGTNGLAIAALTLGILWVCGLGSLLAVIFGIIALNQIKSRGQRGKGLAIAGLILGGLGLIATVVATIAVVRTADEFVTTDPDEFDDVELTDCSTDGNGNTVAVLEVTNDSSRPSTYILTVEFGRDGDSIGVETVPTLDPGASTTVEVQSTSKTSGDARCRVQIVQRLAAG